MKYLDPFAMKKRCGDCAFSPESEAYGCESTRLTAELCVLSGEPFYCHRADAEGHVRPRLDDRGEAVLCRGFVDAFSARGPESDWQAAVASESLRILEDAMAGKTVTPDAMRDRIIVAGERAQMQSEAND